MKWDAKFNKILAKFAPSYLVVIFIAFSCIYAHFAVNQNIEVRLYMI
jgi:hypothetical protein